MVTHIESLTLFLNQNKRQIEFDQIERNYFHVLHCKIIIIGSEILEINFTLL